MKKLVKKYNLTERDIDRIVEMAWEDRTPFDAIETQFGVPEADVIKLMKAYMRERNWRKWRARVQGRSTKHAHKRSNEVGRFKSKMQRQVSRNKISKKKY